jgi:molecular chaperone DnaJ
MNLYEILQVDKHASLDDIKASYRKLAKIHHPDKNADGNDETFKQINQAYKILSDPKLKHRYDTTGQVDEKPTPSFNNFHDIFNMFNPFQKQSSSSTHAPSKGKPLECKIKLTMEQYIFGCERKFQIDRMDWCKCELFCEHCQGQGVMKKILQVGPLQVVQNANCGFCQSTGKRPEPSCVTCKGTSKVKFEKIVSISIPPRCLPNWSKTYEGLGEPGNKREDKPGDLIVTIELEPNQKFSLIDNKHIMMTYPLSLQDSICGTILHINCLDMNETIDTSTIGICPDGYIHVIKNKGLGNGDFMVKFKIEWPERKPLTEFQKSQKETIKNYFESGVTPQ